MPSTRVVIVQPLIVDAMDINPIVKYLNTLKNVGYIRNTEVSALAVYAFLDYIVENEDEVGLDNTMLADVNNILHCLRDKNCLLANVEAFKCTINQVLQGLLLTAGSTIIKTAGGIPIKLN